MNSQVAFLLLFLLLPFAARLQTADFAGWLPDFQQDVRAYVVENINPEIADLQAELEAAFTEAQLELLAQKREEARTLQEQSGALISRLLTATLKGMDREAIETMFGEAIRSQIKALTGLLIGMDPILSAHRKPLQEKTQGVQSKVKGWRADIRSLRRQYASDEELARLRRNLEEQLTEKGYPDLLQRLESMAGLLRNSESWRPRAVLLLFWDAQMDASLLFQTDAEELALVRHARTEPTTRLIRCYPNPAGSRATIEFELAKPVPSFTLQIATLNGEVLQKKSGNDLSAGAHSFQMETGALPPGTYLVNLRLPGWEDSRRLVVGDRP